MQVTQPIVYPFSLESLPSFMQTHVEVLDVFILKRLMEAIRSDCDETVLFVIKNTDSVAKIVRSDYTMKLVYLKESFVRREQYEYAQLADKYLRKHLAQVLIEETKYRE
jgi:hypothetical protein